MVVARLFIANGSPGTSSQFDSLLAIRQLTRGIPCEKEGVQNMDKVLEFILEDLSVPTTALYPGEFVVSRHEPIPDDLQPEVYDYIVYTPGKPRVIIGRPPREAQIRMTQIEKEYSDHGFKGQITAVHKPHEAINDSQVRIHLVHDS